MAMVLLVRMSKQVLIETGAGDNGTRNVGHLRV